MVTVNTISELDFCKYVLMSSHIIEMQNPYKKKYNNMIHISMYMFICFLFCFLQNTFSKFHDKYANNNTNELFMQTRTYISNGVAVALQANRVGLAWKIVSTALKGGDLAIFANLRIIQTIAWLCRKSIFYYFL